MPMPCRLLPFNVAMNDELVKKPRRGWKYDVKNMTCPVCGKVFSVSAKLKRQKQTCSIPCRYKNVKNNGHTYVSGNGYTYIKDHSDQRSILSGGYVLLHRKVMEEKLGRLLQPGECVHHVNGIRTDNRPENLELFSSHADHMTHHYSESVNRDGIAPFQRHDRQIG